MTHTEQKNSNGIPRQVIACGWIRGTASCGQIFEYKRVIATKYMYDLHSGLKTCSSTIASNATKRTQETTLIKIHLYYCQAVTAGLNKTGVFRDISRCTVRLCVSRCSVRLCISRCTVRLCISRCTVSLCISRCTVRLRISRCNVRLCISRCTVRLHIPHRRCSSLLVSYHEGGGRKLLWNFENL